MKKRKAHASKSNLIKKERGFSPEEVATDGLLVDRFANPNYAGQTIEVYRFNNYVWAVVVEEDRLVSAWPSRKLKRIYGV